MDSDTCKTVEIGGQVVRVRGSGDLTDSDREMLAEVVAAAKRKMAADPRLAEEATPDE